ANSNVTLFDPQTGSEVGKLAAGAQRLAWTPDSQTLTTSESGTVTFWDPATGKNRDALPVASNTFLYWSPVYPRAFEPRGSTIWVWDTATCQVLHKLEHPAALYTWAPSRDGRTLACSLTNQSIVLWDLAKGTKVQTIEKAGVVAGLAWSPDDSLLAGILNSTTIGIWQPATGQHLHTLTGHKQAISNISWAPQGKVLASGGVDETVREWNAETGKLTATFPMPKAKVTHNQI